MAMKGKWLRPTSSPQAPAKAGGGDLVRDDFNRRIAQFKKARGIAETFQLATFCAVQRKHFITVFERFGPGELFKPSRTNILSSEERMTPLGAQALFRIPTSELSDWQCLCGRTNYVKCHCGTISCLAADRAWCCPSCGSAGKLSPLESVGGSKGSSNAGLLPKAANHPLLPRR